ncbi:MAG: mechanosensitive ion channel [Cyclobacteriaceae bacterium]|nr:mechanosensitive ion channel [Cyclobacteriaceae bacterium HetDA_MAG_MS6]
MKDVFTSLWEWVSVTSFSLWEIFTTPLFHLGQSGVSIGTVVYFLAGFLTLSYLSKRAKKFLIDRFLLKSGLDVGTRATIGTVTRFLILLIGSIIIVQSAGIDLSALSLLAGALGVGIGFGLQNITDNFISGIIILFEKPIKVGDRIEVGDVQGDVISISVRATTILTNDNISIIVPNSEFISGRVINWSHNDRNIRFRIPVGVSYQEDPEQVRQILIQVAADSTHVLEKPEPIVLFDEFADSSINFTLAVWTSSHTDKPLILKSALYFEIFKKFRENGIEIPFPQRDLHIKRDLVEKIL